jgi:conjugal transfer pilin signal peptidase TrbI
MSFREMKKIRLKTLIILIISLLIGLLISNRLVFVVNVTESLPQVFWLGVKGITPKKGDYIVFTASGHDMSFIKRIAGESGDEIKVKGCDFFIDNEYVATAKTHSLEGKVLDLSEEGKLREGEYFVLGEHKDSFDSRYKQMGRIEESRILAVAYPLW